MDLATSDSAPGVNTTALAERIPLQPSAHEDHQGRAHAAAGDLTCLPVRPMAPGVLAALLRSAVALQAEGLLRTAGALSGTFGQDVDHAAWVERDARDLSALTTAAAAAAGATLPAGMDTGAGDPDNPASIVEGLLAHNEALVNVLRELTSVSTTGHAPVNQNGNDVDGCGPEPWQRLVRAVLQRREEEIVLLRAAGATGHVPPEPTYRRGQPPRHF